MQIIQIPEGIEEPIPTYGGLSLEGGMEYLCTNAFAGSLLLSRHPVIIDGKVWSFRKLVRSYSIDFESFDPDEDWNYKDVWLYRGGGWGDLLLLTPLIRELKSHWPYSRIHVACGAAYHCLFKGIDVICEYLPIPYNKNVPIDGLINFEELVEGDPMAHELNMVQLFARQAGITLTSIKPDYHVTKSERVDAIERYPDNDLPRIGIQLLASGFYRTYPQMATVMTKLAKHAQVFLFGKPGQIELQGNIDNVFNLMEHRLNFRQSAAVISTCDVCVSPDSVLVHLSSALDVPCVGIYGPFPSGLRLTSSLAYAFNGVADCAPCFFHADTPDQFPLDMPCSECKRCVAIESVDPDAVVAKVLELVLNTGTLPGSTQ